MENRFLTNGKSVAVIVSKYIDTISGDDKFAAMKISAKGNVTIVDTSELENFDTCSLKEAMDFLDSKYIQYRADILESGFEEINADPFKAEISRYEEENKLTLSLFEKSKEEFSSKLREMRLITGDQTSIIEDLKTQLKDMKKKNAAEMKVVLAKGDDRISELNKFHHDEIEKLEKSHFEKTRELKSNHDKAMKELADKHTSVRDEIKDELQVAMNKISDFKMMEITNEVLIEEKNARIKELELENDEYKKLMDEGVEAFDDLSDELKNVSQTYNALSRLYDDLVKETAEDRKEKEKSIESLKKTNEELFAEKQEKEKTIELLNEANDHLNIKVSNLTAKSGDVVVEGIIHKQFPQKPEKFRFKVGELIVSVSTGHDVGEFTDITPIKHGTRLLIGAIGLEVEVAESNLGYASKTF